MNSVKEKITRELSANEAKRSSQVAPGARVRLAADWGKLHAGDELVVSHLDGPGLVVSSVDAKEELWIPASLIPNSSFSRAWSFRPRKADIDKNIVGPPKLNEKKGPPKVLGGSSPVRVTTGEVARLSIEVSNAENAVVNWTKEGTTEREIVQNERHQIRQSAGLLYLEISRCRLSDSGVYRCDVQCDNGTCSAKISLCVVGKLNIRIFIIFCFSVLSFYCFLKIIEYSFEGNYSFLILDCGIYQKMLKILISIVAINDFLVSFHDTLKVGSFWRILACDWYFIFLHVSPLSKIREVRVGVEIWNNEL